MDFLQRPFGCVLELAAQEGACVRRLTAECSVLGCKIPAQYTARLVDSQELVLVGESGAEYAPVCEVHFKQRHSLLQKIRRCSPT